MPTRPNKTPPQQTHPNPPFPTPNLTSNPPFPTPHTHTTEIVPSSRVHRSHPPITSYNFSSSEGFSSQGQRVVFLIVFFIRHTSVCLAVKNQANPLHDLHTHLHRQKPLSSPSRSLIPPFPHVHHTNQIKSLYRPISSSPPIPTPPPDPQSHPQIPFPQVSPPLLFSPHSKTINTNPPPQQKHPLQRRIPPQKQQQHSKLPPYQPHQHPHPQSPSPQNLTPAHLHHPRHA